jgi:hypothetical protein
MESDREKTSNEVMAALVAAIPIGRAASFPVEMAGESSPHAASVFLT